MKGKKNIQTLNNWGQNLCKWRQKIRLGSNDPVGVNKIKTAHIWSYSLRGGGGGGPPGGGGGGGGGSKRSHLYRTSQS